MDNQKETVSKELFKRATSILNDKIVNLEEKLEKINHKEEKYQSDNISELASALSKAQGDMEIAGKSSSGYNFKYADLTKVVTASREMLCNNGLSVLQPIITNKISGKNYLETILLHESGQWIKSSMLVSEVQLQGKTPMQSFGAAVTYLKRYCYASIIGVVSASEEDIDNG